jgi:hypothetical protein
MLKMLASTVTSDQAQARPSIAAERNSAAKKLYGWALSRPRGPSRGIRRIDSEAVQGSPLFRLDRGDQCICLRQFAGIDGFCVSFQRSYPGCVAGLNGESNRPISIILGEVIRIVAEVL